MSGSTLVVGTRPSRKEHGSCLGSRSCGTLSQCHEESCPGVLQCEAGSKTKRAASWAYKRKLFEARAVDNHARDQPIDAEPQASASRKLLKKKTPVSSAPNALLVLPGALSGAGRRVAHLYLKDLAPPETST